MNRNLNQELSQAFQSSDFDKVEALLLLGADGNILKRDPQKSHHFYSYIKFSTNSAASARQHRCSVEMNCMNMEMVNKKTSLYDFVKSEKPLYSRDKFDESIIKKYEVFNDLIQTKLRKRYQKGHLLDKLRSLQLNLDLSETSISSRKRNVLDGYCLFKIGESLSNDDLLNFLIAIDESTDPSEFSLNKYL